MKRLRLTTVKPRLQSAPSRQVATVPTTKDRRLSGRKLQDRRLKVWSRDPRCAVCGKLCDFPAGFELDHVVPLHQGGEDIEANTQVLCVSFDVIDGQLVKAGCHYQKTAQDLRGG